MKKIKNFISKNYSKIMLIVLITIVITSFSGNIQIFAAINPDTVEQDPGILQRLLGWVLGIASGVAISPIATLILAVEIVIFVLLCTIFGAAGLGFGLPFPDDLIFNRVAFFDPNFINPTTVSNAPIHIMQSVIRNLYFSTFTIATAIFIVAAMIIGIKLAITSIAEEKATYKKSLTNWIMGIVLLFSAHFIMSAIFKLNETIVHTASKSASNVEFQVDLVSAMPVGTGKTLRTLMNTVADFFTSENDGTNLGKVPVKGYGGLVLSILVKAIGGDLIYVIAFGALLGQIVALIVAYIKRLFYCIFLGVMAPLIIAMDVIKKSIA